MPKDTNHCEKLRAALESLLSVLVLSRLNFAGRGRLNSVFGRERFFESSALEGKEIAPPGRGVEGNKSDLQRIEEIIPQISELMANLLITNGEGEIDREQMRRISVKVGKLSTKLLEVSLDGGEISDTIFLKM